MASLKMWCIIKKLVNVMKTSRILFSWAFCHRRSGREYQQHPRELNTRLLALTALLFRILSTSFRLLNSIWVMAVIRCLIYSSRGNHNERAAFIEAVGFLYHDDIFTILLTHICYKHKRGIKCLIWAKKLWMLYTDCFIFAKFIKIFVLCRHLSPN